MLGTASTGHLHRHELPYGVLLHTLLPCQKTSRIQNRVLSLYESELTVTLSGTTLKGCKLQDTELSPSPRAHGHIYSRHGKAAPPRKPRGHTALRGGEGCAAARLLPLCKARGAGEQEGNLQESFLGAPEGSNSANAEGFCSVVIFAARSVDGSGSYMGNISPFDRERA